MIKKGNSQNRIITVVFLFISLLIGFDLGSSDIETMEKIEETEHTAITAQTEIHYDEPQM